MWSLPGNQQWNELKEDSWMQGKAQPGDGEGQYPTLPTPPALRSDDRENPGKEGKLGRWGK